MSIQTNLKSFHLRNSTGFTVEILNYGATIKSISTPDRNGHIEDVVLGFNDPREYLEKQHPYFGATVGRYANRIANGKFSINGKTYTLVPNYRGHHIHGGKQGFDKRFWVVKESGGHPGNASSVTLTYTSKDGEEGYPGILKCTVTFTVTAQNDLQIAYRAESDADTIVNLTNHSYFNLGGEGCLDIGGHEVQILADRITTIDAHLIPTGDFIETVNTPFDFSNPTRVASNLSKPHPQKDLCNGFDHNFVLNADSHDRREVKTAAIVTEPESGRRLTVLTTEPGMQFYTCNAFDGSFVGKSGIGYGKFSGLCLETQHFPDSPNHSSFPSTFLRPGEVFQSSTVLRFDVID